MTWPRRIFAGVAALAALGVLAIGLLFAALSIERRSPTELPTPTGSFAVGRAIYDWRDTAHEVLVWIWYPAMASPSSEPDVYVPAPMLAAVGPAGFPFSFVYRDPAKVRAHSIRNAAIPQNRSFPVVILTGPAGPGAGYSTLAEDLASHGYVVVGIDAPYRSGVVAFPDGRVIRRTDENELDAYEGEE